MGTSEWSNVNNFFCKFRSNNFELFFVSAASTQRNQTQVGDRHQIDDMQTNNARTNAAASPVAPSRASIPTNTSDELGPLPPGWQMSKNDNERAFFIDHINKRTTWVNDQHHFLVD